MCWAYVVYHESRIHRASRLATQCSLSCVRGPVLLDPLTEEEGVRMDRIRAAPANKAQLRHPDRMMREWHLRFYPGVVRARHVCAEWVQKVIAVEQFATFLSTFPHY